MSKSTQDNIPQPQQNEPVTKRVETVPVDEATAADLRAFARLFGIELQGSETRTVLLAKLKTVGFSGDSVPKLTNLPTPAAADMNNDDIPSWVGPLVPGGKPRRLCCINIMRREVPGGSEPVTPNVNGKRFDIPRGQDCVVPIEYVEALVHAVERHYSGNLTDGITDYTDVPQFPFQFRPRPASAEVLEEA